MVLLAYDLERKRPGCVLVAASMGADTSAARAFPAEMGLTAPTPDMRVYSVTDQQLLRILLCTLRYHAERTPIQEV